MFGNVFTSPIHRRIAVVLFNQLVDLLNVARFYENHNLDSHIFFGERCRSGVRLVEILGGILVGFGDDLFENEIGNW